MPEIGIPYTLTGPDGTRAVFNDPTDLDFVGYLDSENGITGLLDSAEVREDIDVKPEADGVIQGNNLLGRRTGTLQGIIWPLPDIATVERRRAKIFRASRGLGALKPAILSWTPTSGIQRMLPLWRQGSVKINGRRPKQFLIPLASADPYVYSAAVQTAILPGLNTSGDAGVSSPLFNPVNTRFSSVASALIVNQGDANTWGVFSIVGPLTNPTLLNNTTGLQWTLTTTLGYGPTSPVVVDSGKRTVTYLGTNKYGLYAANFATNVWWPLVPGVNDIHLLTSTVGLGAQVTIQWRHAWE